MGIIEILICICLIVCLTIYIHIEKLNSYKEGFLDGVKHYSNMVEEVLHCTNQWNKETETGMTAFIESIKPLNKSESEEAKKYIRFDRFLSDEEIEAERQKFRRWSDD